MNCQHRVSRRNILFAGLGVAAGSLLPSARVFSKPSSSMIGIPGPYRGRVVTVQHPRSILSGRFQPEPVRDMMHKGMLELTGAGDWAEAWRVFFEPGDVVGIKVNPVGQPH